MSKYTRTGAVLGLLSGVFIGFLVCYLEYPFPRYTLVGSEMIVELTRRLLSPEVARSLDRPFHLFLVYALAGGAGGAIVGALSFVLARVAGRRPDRRGRFRLIAFLFFAVLFFGYLAAALLHFRLPSATGYPVAAVVLILSILLSFVVSVVLARFVPAREVERRGLGVAVIFAILVVVLFVSYGSTASSRGRPVVQGPAAAPNGNKVVLLCVDGIGWSLVQPLLDGGKLPAFQRLIHNGSRGILRSTLPPIESPVVWTSVATDRLPKDHRVLGFVSKSPRTGLRIPTNNRVRRKTTFWEILTRADRTVDVLSWYPSWPPDPIAGVMLSNRATYAAIPERVYPESYDGLVDSLTNAYQSRISELRDRITPYEPDEDPDRPGDGGLAAMRRGAMQVMDQAYVRDMVTVGFAERLIERGQPDVMAIYFRGSDTVQHKFRKYHAAVHDPLITSLLYDVSPWEVEQFGGVLDAYLMFVDESIGKIMESLDPNTTIFLISDHAGGYRYDGEIRMSNNSILRELGFATGGYADEKANSQAYGVWDAMSGRLLRIYINLQGREKTGIVPPSRYTSLLGEIRERIAALETTAGTPLFLSVREGEWAGAAESDGDLLAELNRAALGGALEIGGKTFPVSDFAWRFTKSGNHRISGVIVASGNHITPDKRIRGATIYDVTPTMFYLLGLPLAKDWEGKVLDPIIAADFRKTHPVTWVETYETGPERSRDIDPELDGANEKVLDELKALGYIQ